MVAVKAVPIPIYKKQAEFRQSPATYRGFVGGRGCGKSKIGALDLFKRAKAGRHYCVAAPTYRLLKDASYVSFTEVGEQLGAIVDTNMGDFRAIIRTQDGGEATINFRSAEMPEKTFRGPNLSGVVLDEASVMRETAFLNGIATLREGGELGWMSLLFTPKGKGHWTYGVFYDRYGQPKADSHLTCAHSKDNPFLPQGFVDAIAGQYTSSLQRQELAGEFLDGEGQIFRREWFPTVPEVPMLGTRVRYWDSAGTQDDGCFTVGLLMCAARDGLFYIEDVVRGQWSAFNRLKVMEETAKRDALKYGNTVHVFIEQEPGSGGKDAILFSARALAGFPVWPDHPSGDKMTRAQPLAAQAEAGNIRIKLANWNDDYLDELCTAPESKYMDQVDASSGAFNRLVNAPATAFQGDVVAYPRSNMAGPVENDLLSWLKRQDSENADRLRWGDDD